MGEVARCAYLTDDAWLLWWVLRGELRWVAGLRLVLVGIVWLLLWVGVWWLLELGWIGCGILLRRWLLLGVVGINERLVEALIVCHVFVVCRLNVEMQDEAKMGRFEVVKESRLK